MRPDRLARLDAALVCSGVLLVIVVSCAASPSGAGSYQVPTPAQLASGEQMFSQLFARDSMAAARTLAAELGFSWRETDFDIALVDTQERGWGEYHFSKSAPGDLVLHVPHRRSDRHTGEIAMQVYSGREIVSIALNSVSRRTPVDSGAGPAADMARLPNSFHAIHARAFAMRYPQGRLVQLHGFDPNKRRSRQGREASVIISTGSTWSSAYLLETQRCFSGRGWHALRYPQQVRELGGTKNSIGALMRNMGHRGFTHVELSYDTRENLRSDREQLAAFAACLLGGTQ